MRRARSLAGSLIGPGWHKPGEPVSYTAGDNSGIRFGDDERRERGPRGDPRACDFTYPVPARNAASRPLRFAPPLPDGRYPIPAHGRPMRPGMRARSTRRVSIDGSARGRSALVARAHDLVGARDHASGFTGGQILVRNGSGGAVPRAPTTTGAARCARRWIAATRAGSTSR